MNKYFLEEIIEDAVTGQDVETSFYSCLVNRLQCAMEEDAEALACELADLLSEYYNQQHGIKVPDGILASVKKAI